MATYAILVTGFDKPLRLESNTQPEFHNPNAWVRVQGFMVRVGAIVAYHEVRGVEENFLPFGRTWNTE